MTSIDEIRTPKMLLVRMQASDLAELEHMYADPIVMATLGGVRSKEAVAKYLDTHLAHWQEYGYGFWTVRDPLTGQFAGRGGLRHMIVDGRPELEVGYGFVREYWGRGWATELARESVRVAFEELKRPDLVCFTLPTNLASKRVMQKVGFVYEKDIVHADLPHVFYRQLAPTNRTRR